MKLEVVMFMISVLKIKNCLILVDIQLIQSIMIVQIVLGKMKDEFNEVKIDEFVGLKSKMYSLISGDWEVNKAKGVYIKLKHSEYLNVLFGRKVLKHKMTRIPSERHNVGTYLISQLILF